MRWVTRAALVALLVLPHLGLAGQAVAQDSRGADRLIDSPDLQGDEQPTVEERYPQSSYVVPDVTDQGNHPGSWSKAATRGSGNFVSQLLQSAAGLFARAAGSLVQWAFDARLTGWVTDNLTDLLSGVADSVWAPFVVPMALLGAAWIGWHALARQRGTSAVQGALWMVAVVGFGTLLLAQPGWLFGSVNDFSREVSSKIFANIASIGTTEAAHPAASSYYGDEPPTYASNTDTEQARRQAADHVWRILMWEPWRAVVFANDRDANEYGERLLSNPTVQEQEDIHEDLKEDYEEEGGEEAYPVRHYAGHHPGTRITVSSLALLAALATSIAVMILAAALIVLQLAGLVLTIIAPLALLVGIHPGVGRTVTMQWLELWLGVWLKRIILTAVLSAVVAVHGLILQNTMHLSWFVAALLIVLTTVAALMYRKALTSMLTRLSLAHQPGADAGRAMHQQRTGRGGLRRAAVTAAMVKTAGAYGLAKGAKAGRYARHQARRVPHATGRGGGEASGGDAGGTAGPPSGAGGAPPLPGGEPLPSGDGPVVPVQAGPRRRSLTAPRALPTSYNGRPSRGNGHAGGLAGRGLAQRRASGYRLTDAGRHRLAQLHRPLSPMAQPPSQRPHYIPYTDASQPMGRPSNAPWSRWARQRSADHHVWRQARTPSRVGRRRR